MSGGSRRVYLGSQRVARAVVSWFATVKGDEVLLGLLEPAVDAREAEGREVGKEEAVVKVVEDVWWIEMADGVVVKVTVL